MRRLFTLLFSPLIFYCSAAIAQQRPQYTQYVFNNFLLNPAVAGIENYIDTKFAYRTQWTGLEGAPVTTYLSAHAPLGREFVRGDAAGMGSDGANPMNRSYTLNYRAAPPHHGIGFTAVMDKAGPLSQSNLNAVYAYHLGVTDRLNVSVGVSAGVSVISLNTGQLILENPLDPAISNGNNNQLKPDVGMGIWAYAADYFVGVSVQQLLPQRLRFADNSAYNQSKTVPHYFFTAGYKLFLGDDVSLLPSVLVKVVKPVPTTFDINAKLAFQDRFWIGGSYRNQDAFAAMAGFNISYLLNVGYSYDFTTSALNRVSNGTHEIVVGLTLNNRYRDACPQKRMW
ncbi:MAG: type IX secretion system membrane protein PorP/SprF [Mucilaginibacter polytrichastri]|nr:type IX secretion system membrane protein PorP/SprF [Mucilaginibacter polytrichastri]